MGTDSKIPNLKIALVHDWLITVGGAEKVLKQLIEVFPHADIFTAIDLFNPSQRADILRDKKTKVSYLQRVPFIRKLYRYLIPYHYRAIERFNLSGYDLIVSSSHAIAKSIRKTPDQVHICYCHTPMRYAWNMRDEYLDHLPGIFRRMAEKRFLKLQEWDKRTVKNVDYFIANSNFVAERIQEHYQQKAVVINPPVNVTYYQPSQENNHSPEAEPYFLVVSRFVFYKRLDIIISAFNKMPDKRLVIIGEGPQKSELRKRAAENIIFKGHQSEDTVKHYMQFARALVLAAIEDFGITALEAQACGTPVIAYNYGGYKDSILPMRTGVLYDKQSKEDLQACIKKFDAMENTFEPEILVHHVKAFGNGIFRKKIADFVHQKME